MNDFLTRALRLRKVLTGQDFYRSRQVRRRTLTLGNRHADWTFFPDNLQQDSLVYSFGVGTDISFDLELIRVFGLQVHAFDPAPESERWLAGQILPERFYFHPYGLAGSDSLRQFVKPSEKGINSLRMVHDAPALTGTGSGDETLLEPDYPSREDVFSLPVKRLSTITGELGHEWIDILKMDIEGAEYPVIEDILACPVRIGQILIEFHHRFDPFGINDTHRALKQLNAAGYQIFHVSATGQEFSFIKTQPGS